MKRRPLFFLLVLITTASVFAQTPKTAPSQKKMDDFINNLMSKMTLDEKIGQLNLVSVGFDVTGPIVSKNVNENIEKGNVGGVFNTFTPNAVRKPVKTPYIFDPPHERIERRKSARDDRRQRDRPRP